jgi:hypothetical protein
MIKLRSFIEKKIYENYDNGLKKFNLILGLGQCIIHHEHIMNVTVANEMNNQQNRKKINKNISKEIFYVKTKGETYKIYLREGVINFLKKMEKYFNIYIYTFFNFDFAIVVCNQINKICKKKIINKIVHKNDIYSNEEIKKRKKKLLHIDNININKTIIIDSYMNYWDMIYHYRLIEISPYNNCCDINPIENIEKKFPFSCMNDLFYLCEIFLIAGDLEKFYTLLKDREELL